jgi:tRNA pseudouridine38-40 synthase
MPRLPFNYSATIAYDGTDYFGYQRQEGLPTIQQTLEESIYEAVGEWTNVFASSRTDRGVHALGQVISFRLGKDMHPAGLGYQIQTFLPQSITIKNCQKAPSDFFARFASREKTYAYIVYNTQTVSPVIPRYAWTLWSPKIDVDFANRICKGFLGTHDFTCFGKVSKESENKSPICTISHFEAMRQNDYVVFTLTGDHFLHNMVRRIMGFVYFCCRGSENPDRLERIFSGEQCIASTFVAPASGLYLVKVDYKGII